MKQCNENTIYFDKAWDLFGNLFQKEKVLCCSIISKGKSMLLVENIFITLKRDEIEEGEKDKTAPHDWWNL